MDVTRSAIAALSLMTFGGPWCVGASAALNVSVLYQWDGTLSADSYTSLCGQTLISENNVITGVKVWENDVYVTVPRWLPGVPATLNKLVPDGRGSARLQPFPDCAWNKIGDPAALQYTQSMEIDSQGRMWIIDVGRRDIFAPTPNNEIPPKLVIYDIAKRVAVRTYTFPDSVLSYTSSFLNDIVLDEVNMRAYMSNTLGVEGSGGIVTYDYKTNSARRFSAASTRATPGYACCDILGSHWSIAGNSDGIALTPDLRHVFYSAISSTHLWSVPTSALFESWNAEQTAYDQAVDEQVTLHGLKAGVSDGMNFDSGGTLYYGVVQENAVYTWRPRQHFAPTKARHRSSLHRLPGERVVYSNVTTMQWLDTFAFNDTAGTMLFTTNKLFQFLNHSLLPDSTNIRIMELRPPNGIQSYLSNQRPILGKMRGDEIV
jgi:hypothetical protein|eukprot:TRINITY_DN69762_c0_g1_i1.p1 TRINITY_DN69762_c0_g1~~TRINITY_DN69762_c0_g1_i1.p1  ORF type:complete len:454 (+),score=36.70 TRINITY_DN69762_c0_g1_i1:71-1363(+)